VPGTDAVEMLTAAKYCPTRPPGSSKKSLDADFLQPAPDRAAEKVLSTLILPIFLF
jgi:hypothetical protein